MMIQRIQSIYLLLATAISGGLIFVFNLWKTPNNHFCYAIFLKKILFVKWNSFIIFTFRFLYLCRYLFIYKRRQLQFVLGRISILINLFLLGLLIYVSLTLPGEVKISEKGIGMFLPILAIVFAFVLQIRLLKRMKIS